MSKVKTEDRKYTVWRVKASTLLMYLDQFQNLMTTEKLYRDHMIQAGDGFEENLMVLNEIIQGMGSMSVAATVENLRDQGGMAWRGVRKLAWYSANTKIGKYILPLRLEGFKELCEEMKGVEFDGLFSGIDNEFEYEFSERANGVQEKESKTIKESKDDTVEGTLGNLY